MVMKVVANISRSTTVQLIEIELSKAYLYRALRCTDSDSDSICCLANVYLAVLYCTTGQYQTAIDHCTLVTRSQSRSQCNLHVVQGELLPQTDNEIDTVLGLAVFYQYVRTAALSQQEQTQHVSIFTTELFAHYLCIRCLSVIQCRQLIPTYEIQQYEICFRELYEMCIADVLAFKLVRGTKYPGHCHKLMFVKDQTKPVTSDQLDTSKLVELLKQSAVEHLTTFRQIEAQIFHSIGMTVTTDYEALYAYKCGEHQRCLQLSTHNVRTLIGDLGLQNDGDPVTTSVVGSFVFAYPEFIQFVDDDISSLTGLMIIVYPLCRELVNHVSVSQLSISLYLMTQCQMKLHHPMTSLSETLNYIHIACRRRVYEIPLELSQLLTLEQLLLKLIKQKILRYISVDSD